MLIESSPSAELRVGVSIRWSTAGLPACILLPVQTFLWRRRSVALRLPSPHRSPLIKSIALVFSLLLVACVGEIGEPPLCEDAECRAVGAVAFTVGADAHDFEFDPQGEANGALEAVSYVLRNPAALTLGSFDGLQEKYRLAFLRAAERAPNDTSDQRMLIWQNQQTYTQNHERLFAEYRFVMDTEIHNLSEEEMALSAAISSALMSMMRSRPGPVWAQEIRNLLEQFQAN